MNRCPNCRQLAGQPGEVDPPEEMRAVSQYFTPEGSVEVYRCRPCGSQWERFVANAKQDHGAQSGPWKIRKAVNA